MFVFGHLGVGSKLIAPFTKGLPKFYIFLGTLLPDLIDKPLYYGLSWYTHQRGADLGLISGTRTFGHSALGLLLLLFINLIQHSPVLIALIFGVGSHLILDGLGDYFEATRDTALFWPILSTFPIIPYNDLQDHMLSLNRPFILIGEGVGLFLVLWQSKI